MRHPVSPPLPSAQSDNRIFSTALSGDELGLRFDAELLKAWLTLRFNPSEKHFLERRGIKNNRARKLSIKDFKISKFEGSADKTADRLRTVLFEVVQSMARNVPQEEKIGVLTSGGIDSTTVMAILCSLGYRPEAFAIGFGTENDEIETASMAADFLGVSLHARILNNVLALTPDANRCLEEPYRAACYYYDTLKFVRESGIRYLFDGLGADEFFGGYAFRYQKVLDLTRKGMARLDAYLRGAHPNDHVGSESDLFGKRLRHIEVSWRSFFPYFENDLTILDQVFLADYNAKCRQNFIPLASLAAPLGMHMFFPWLDDKLVDFSMQVPTEWKYDIETGQTKILFRRAVRGLVPESTMQKTKQGFGPDPSRVYEELKPLAQDTIADSVMAANGYVNSDYYWRLLAKKTCSTLEINKLWDFYTMEAFLNEIG